MKQRGKLFHAGQVVYLRCRVVGFEHLCPPFVAGEHMILEQIDRHGKTAALGSEVQPRLYVREETAIPPANIAADMREVPQ